MVVPILIVPLEAKTKVLPPRVLVENITNSTILVSGQR